MLEHLKEGTAFLGSDLGLRALEVNLGPFKTEWKVLGPWSLDFCMVSTLSIKNETCARCSMLTAFSAEPHFLNHHSSRRVAAVWLIFLDLDLEVLESNNFPEKRIRCKMFHVNCPLFPNSPWKLRFFQNLQREWKFRKGTCPFMRPKPKLLHSQGHPCRNRRLGFSGSSPKLWFLHFWAQNCGSKGGPLSETQKSNFWVGASYWNWSVLNGRVFLGKLGTLVDE